MSGMCFEHECYMNHSLGLKEIWVRKYLGPKIILGPKIFLSKNFPNFFFNLFWICWECVLNMNVLWMCRELYHSVPPKKFWSQKNFWSWKKNFGPEKIFGPKKFWVRNFFGPKILSFVLRSFYTIPHYPSPSNTVNMPSWS